MRNFFLSDNIDGGGIAFNIKAIVNNYNKSGNEAKAIFLKKNTHELFAIQNFYQNKINIYTTSVKSLYIAVLLSFFRILLFKKTYIFPIIYHPRFADSSISFFRKLVRISLLFLPINNLRFYSLEALYATKISKTYENTIIGLESDILNVEEEEISMQSRNFIQKNTTTLKILTVARFVDFKMGYILGLIDFVNSNRNYELLIVGFGPLENKLLERANDSSRIFFCGKQNIGQIKKLLNICNIYIGMGTTLVDATYLNKPAIIAIESSDNAFVSGVYGENNNYSYGEFSKSSKYYNLSHFFENFDLSKININIKKDSVSDKLILLEKKSKEMNIFQIIIILIWIPIIFLFRKVFREKDYQ